MKFRHINTLLRLIIVCLLVYPFPIAMAVEQTETESFNADGTNQTDLVFDYSYNDTRNICWNRLDTYTGLYGTTGQSLNWNTCLASDAVLRMTFPDDYISSAGFNLGAADFTWYVTWNYTDGTSSSKTSYNAHNAGYETVSHTAPTDKYIETVDVETDDYVLLDDITWTYDDGITSGVGAPTNLTVSANLHTGAITVDWDAPGNTYQYSPERYAIGFDKADPPSYAVASGNVGDSNALDTEYTFTKSYLQSAIDAQVGDTLYFKIRSDNDTNSSYSSWTAIASYTIQDVASGPTEFSIQNTSYQGLQFSWTATDTGWASLDYYKIQYKLSSEETYTDIQITDTTATSYTIEDISAGTYDFNLYACTDGGFCHGAQAGPANNFEVNENTATTTTTTTTIPPTEEELNYAETGIYETNSERKAREEREAEAARIKAAEDWERDKNFKETGIRELDSERRVREAAEAEEAARDAERSENQNKWDCYMTNAQIQRGDCEPYNQKLKADEEARLEAERIAEEERLAEEERIAEEKRLEEERIAAELKAKEETEATLEELDIDLPEDEIEEFVEVIKEVEEFIEDLVIEEEVIEIVDIPEEIIIVLPEEEIIDEEPIKEVFEENEVIPVEDDIPEDVGEIFDTGNREGEEVTELTEEQVEEVIEVIETLETEEVVEILEVVVVEEVTEQQVEIVQTVVDKVVEEVENLTVEEQEVVAEVLGFTEVEDVEIIAEAVETDEVVAEAVAIFVEKAVENKDVEDYTLADVVVEVKVDEFLDNPLDVIVDIDLSNIKVTEIGKDMTQDQRQKSKEVVVPVIIASQIISSASVIPIRRVR